LLNIDVGLEYIGQRGADKICKKIHQNYNFDLQILKVNLQIFAINFLNIDGSLKRIGQSEGANFMAMYLVCII
jgi:hypothetical protein